MEWQVLEYPHDPKHPNWFWVIGGVMLVGTITAIALKNFLLAVLILLAGFTLMMFAARRPETITCQLTDKGIRLKNRFHPYEELKSFWVDADHPSEPRIIIESKKIFLPHILVPLATSPSPGQVRGYLARFLTEEKHEHSLVDIVGDILGLS